MATFSAVTRQHILQAIAEYDSRGDDFPGVYGFGPSSGSALVHEGHGYDAVAVLGVAHRYATGRVATADEFHGGAGAVADILRKHGFVVTGPEPAGAAGAARPGARTATGRAGTARKVARRVAAPERPAPVCPTCFMALPATGVCDSCG